MGSQNLNVEMYRHQHSGHSSLLKCGCLPLLADQPLAGTLCRLLCMLKGFYRTV